MFKRTPLFRAFFSSLALLAGTSAFAADYTWSGGAGNWSSWTAWVDGSGNGANINSGPLTQDVAVTARNVTLNNNSTLNINANMTGRFLCLTNSNSPTANIQGGTNSFTFAHISRAGTGISLTSCPTLNFTGGSTTINASAEGRTDGLVFGYAEKTYGKGSMSAGSLSLTNSSQFILGFNASGTGSFDFSGGTISVNDALYVGSSGIGTFTMSEANASVPTSLSGKIIVGSQASSNGTFNYSGGTISTTSFTVGSAGTGKLNVTGGSLSIPSSMNFKVGTKGSVEVSGGELLFPNGLSIGSANIQGGFTVSGGTLTPSSLSVGDSKAGSLTISAGTVSVKTSDSYFGINGNSTLTMTGGTLDATGKAIKFSSTGTASVQNTLNISGSTTEIKANQFFLTDRTGATTSMTMAGGKITCASQFMVGRNGNATATQSGGTINGGNLFVVASFASSTSSLTLSGTAADSAKTWYVGNFGTGTLKLENITSDATVKNVSGTNLWVGVENGSNGTVEVGSGLVEVQNLSLGYGLGTAGTGLAKGTLKITGGTVKATTQTILGHIYNLIGETEYKSDGTLEISGGSLTTPKFVAANAKQSTASVKVSGTGSLATGALIAGNSEGSSATVEISGGTLSVDGTGTTDYAALFGNLGTANVTVSGGKLDVSGKNVAVGRNATSAGNQFTVSGGQVLAKDFVVGDAGNASLNLTAGSLTTTGEFIIGRSGNSVSSALIDGGTLKVGSNLILSNSATGSSTASLTLTSGTIDSTGQKIFVANKGTGTLTLNGTGTLKASEIHLSHYENSVSNLNIQGGESTISVGTLKSWGATNCSSSVNFIVTETGITTLSLTSISLGASDSITIDAAFSGGYTLPADTELKLLDVSGTCSLSGVTFTSKSTLFKDPVFSASEKTVTVEMSDQPSYGQRGIVPLSLVSGEDFEKLYIGTNLTDEADLNDFADWLVKQTGEKYGVEQGTLYFEKSLTSAENYLWDFGGYSRLAVSANSFSTTLGGPGVPEPATWVLLLVGVSGLLVRTRFGGLVNLRGRRF